MLILGLSVNVISSADPDKLVSRCMVDSALDSGSLLGSFIMEFAG